MNIFKTDRPILAVALGFFLAHKFMSALDFIFQVTGLIGPVVGLQMILITFVAYTLNTRAGGTSCLLTMIFCLVVVMVLDGVVIYLSLNGSALPSSAVPRVVGAELSYILTIAYIMFSKKLRRFKEISA